MSFVSLRMGECKSEGLDLSQTNWLEASTARNSSAGLVIDASCGTSLEWFVQYQVQSDVRRSPGMSGSEDTRASRVTQKSTSKAG
jgi:hypothetical protein